MPVDELRIAALLAVAGWAAIADLRTREIPDAASLAMLGIAGVAALLGTGPGAAASGIGVALGTAIALVGFRLGAIGGGDAKLVAALGASLGPADLAAAAAAATCAGGLASAHAAWRGEGEVAYAPALALGTAFALFDGQRLAAHLATPAVLVGTAVAGCALAGIALQRVLLARRAARRLGGAPSHPTPTGVERDGGGRAAPRGGVLALALGALASGVALALGAGVAIASGVGAVCGVAWHLSAERRRERATLLAETQLAQAIALATSALRAGASPNDALERAARESEPPLAPLLEATSHRLRLGEDPERALGTFATRLPLASARLFATAVAAQWRAGGSFERALGGVARSIRDRVDTARRIDTQTASVRASLVAIVVANAVIAALGWAANPASVEQLVASRGGGAMLAATLWLQAIALLWIARLARRVR